MEQPIMDALNRPMKDLRISVTDRCPFRCHYCMPKEIFGANYPFLKREELLSVEEMYRLASIFAKMGVRKIRLTGGEPLMRKEITEFISMLSGLDLIKDIGLTTNGLLLDRYAARLYNAGLRRLNISMDALDPDVFGKMNGRGISPAIILKHIDMAAGMGFAVKVNMVVQRGVNDQEILPMAHYFKERNIPLRFIEYMDVGNENGWTLDEVITKKEIYESLNREFGLQPLEEHYFGEVAKRYAYSDGKSEIGFISSVSDTFCSSCTRLRLSSDGRLYTCLFASEGFDLRSLLHGGATDHELEQAIIAVWNGRNDRYSELRTGRLHVRNKKIGMSYIGG
ncbi:GTP 3',8-cyclase MoaA [Bacillus sp. 1P06AnD]|uniref:GTP 3',8-cyclase MoaA n=1 Tax=Bacillus sp. 1P06AnD TaxID=3132208 RepID=UPI00399F4522